MAIKILTQRGVDNTNIDGARENYFNSGMRDGIIKGTLNEGSLNTNASNSIYLETCELRIAGHRIVITEPIYITLSNRPLVNTRYSFIAQIIVDDNSHIEFTTFVQSASTELIKQNLYSTENGAGKYQIEIGRFSLLTDGTITDIVRTLDLITGSTANAGYINIGNVSTDMVDEGIDAEVDIENVVDENGEKKTNFHFSLPKTAGTRINVNGEQVEEMNVSQDIQTQFNNVTSDLNSKQTQINDLNTNKLNSNQGNNNANKNLGTDPNGNITTRDFIMVGDIKISKETDGEGNPAICFEFPD